jgi:heat shock protein HslJ
MTEIGFRGETGMKVNKVEERFIDSFRNITNYKLEGDTLLLYYDDGKKYVQFQKKRIK